MRLKLTRTVILSSNASASQHLTEVHRDLPEARAAQARQLLAAGHLGLGLLVGTQMELSQRRQPRDGLRGGQAQAAATTGKSEAGGLAIASPRLSYIFGDAWLRGLAPPPLRAFGIASEQRGMTQPRSGEAGRSGTDRRRGSGLGAA